MLKLWYANAEIVIAQCDKLLIIVMPQFVIIALICNKFCPNL